MTFSEVSAMSQKSKSGELLNVGTDGPFDLYETAKGKANFYESTAEQRRTLFFRGGVLQSGEDIARYNTEQKENTEREEEKKRAQLEFEAKQEQQRIENEKLEKCLSNGFVGLCVFHDESRFFRRLIEKDISNFTLDSDLNRALGEINFMDTRREMNESTGFRLKLRNNMSSDVYDVEVTCFNLAESGTVLGRQSHTYYVRIPSMTIRDVDLVVGDVEQQRVVSCVISNYKS